MTEQERRHLIRLCEELGEMEGAALRCGEGPEAGTRAAERAALHKLMALPDLAGALSAAVGALGDVMLEMQRRRLLAQAKTHKEREILKGGRPEMSDEVLGIRAADAFEAGARVLAAVGHPGAAVFSCGPGDLSSGRRET